jgi:topoisomerase IA-like protein
MKYDEKLGAAAWEAYLGTDPESGHPIHAVSTYFGYKLVLGDTDQPVKSMSVSAGSGPKVPTLEEALQMLMFPRVYPPFFSSC